ncbi:MAG: CYTH domain-containing protein [Rhodospirillales bacterium]|nr:MAG: CYTH domain-containing protein [Rhodospirillales bacterium]
MSREIERKFLVVGEPWHHAVARVAIRQGFLCAGTGPTVRVRIADDRAYLTIKGAMKGLTRDEFEYAIPVADAVAMLDTLCSRPLIEKVRYTVPHAGYAWSVDAFAGDNAGLVVAEIELEDEHEMPALPPWVGQEVSDDPRYLNANLQRHPFSRWQGGG